MLVINAIVNGILYGGVLALLAVGLNLMFGVVQIIHFFYGQLMMVGLYLIYIFAIWCGIPLILSILLAVAAVGLLNVTVQGLVIRHLLDSELINQFLAMVGVMIVLENLCLAIFGTDHRGIPIELPVTHIGELYFTLSNFIAFCGSLIIVGVLYFFLKRTYKGLAIRAVAQDRQIAELMGVNVKKMYWVTMGLGGILAGIVAGFFCPIYSVHPHFGTPFTLLSFVIVVLGGMGNLVGGFIAAFLIGIVTGVVSTLTNPETGVIVSYMLFILCILIRPQGLLGKKVAS